MADAWSIYEAKARFSELMRCVRAGERVRISYRGIEIAEIVPLVPAAAGLSARLDELERAGALDIGPTAPRTLPALTKKRGALRRFLADRE